MEICVLFAYFCSNGCLGVYRVHTLQMWHLLCVCVLTCVWLFATSWTVACQAPLPMKCFRQEYRNELPFPTPGDLPNPGINPVSLAFSALASGFFTTSTTWEAFMCFALLSCFSYVWLFVTLWTVFCQAPLSMGFSRREYWRGLPFPPPGHLPDPESEAASLRSPVLAGWLFTTSSAWQAQEAFVSIETKHLSLTNLQNWLRLLISWVRIKKKCS